MNDKHDHELVVAHRCSKAVLAFRHQCSKVSGFPRLDKAALRVCVSSTERAILASVLCQDALAAQQCTNALLAVLHHYVEVVVYYQVLHNPHCARLVLGLQCHCLLYLHHYGFPVVSVHRLEVDELFDEQQRLRVLVASDESFDLRQQLLGCVRLQSWLPEVVPRQAQVVGCRGEEQDVVCWFFGRCPDRICHCGVVSGRC